MSQPTRFSRVSLGWRGDGQVPLADTGPWFSVGTQNDHVFGESDGVVFNEAGVDIDVRIEGDTATSLLVTDAGLDAVQIGTTVAGAIADFRSATIVFNENGADRDVRIEGDTATSLLVTDAALDAVQVGTTTAGVIADFRTANIVFNENGADRDFRVEGDTAEQLFVTDAGLDAVRIGSGLTAGAIADFRLAAIVFNENSADIDFRVESDANANMFVLDAAAEAVAVGGAINSSATFAVIGPVAFGAANAAVIQRHSSGTFVTGAFELAANTTSSATTWTGAGLETNDHISVCATSALSTGAFIAVSWVTANNAGALVIGNLTASVITLAAGTAWRWEGRAY